MSLWTCCRRQDAECEHIPRIITEEPNTPPRAAILNEIVCDAFESLAAAFTPGNDFNRRNIEIARRREIEALPDRTAYYMRTLYNTPALNDKHDDFLRTWHVVVIKYKGLDEEVKECFAVKTRSGWWMVPTKYIIGWREVQFGDEDLIT